jgi:hypothetical protein
MTRGETRALPPADAHSVESLLRQFATLWTAPQLANIAVELNPRLSRTLGRLPQQKQQPKPKPQPSFTYDHWCPVCQSSRQARRPVKAWRCAACVAVGLDGTLEITRRTRRPTTAR